MTLEHNGYLMSLKEVECVVETIEKNYLVSISMRLKVKCQILPLR